MNSSLSVPACSRAITLPLLASMLLIGGCVPRAAVNIEGGGDALRGDGGYRAVTGRIGVLEPEVMMYDISLGGVLEYRDDWSGSASRRAAVSTAVNLNLMGYGAVLLPDAAGGGAEIFRLKTNMRYHATAFQSSFFSGSDIMTKIDSLTYSVGPIQTLCDTFGIDGVLYIYGAAEKFSDESSASVVGEERTFMAAVLAMKDGRVSWYRHLLVAGSLDIRTEAHSMRMIGAILQ